MKIKCPVCKSNEFVTPIAYGYPSPEMWEKEAVGEIVLGGCAERLDEPNYQCVKCKYEWKRGKRKE